MSNNPFIFVLMEDKVYKGEVTAFYQTKKYGFIQSGDEKYFFFMGNNELAERKKKGLPPHDFSIGDQVEFKLEPGIKEGEYQAYDIIFLTNPSRENLVKEYQEKGILTGYLKKIEDDFFVKEINSYSIIPLNICAEELDFENVYTNRLNELVSFKLKNSKLRLDKLTAFLVDRKLSEKYLFLFHLVESKQEIEVKVTGKNTKGIFLTYDNIFSGFLMFKKSGITDYQCKKGDVISVIVDYVDEQNPKNIQFKLLN